MNMVLMLKITLYSEVSLGFGYQYSSYSGSTWNFYHK
jgi:hypothetical protein